MKRRTNKRKKRDGEEIISSLEADMYLEAIQKAKQRDCKAYIQ